MPGDSVRCPAFGASGAGRTLAPAFGVDMERLGAASNPLAVEDHAGDAFETGQLEHRLEQNRLDGGAQAARACLARDRLVRDRLHRLVVEFEAHVFHLEQALVLLYQGVLGLGEDVDQRLFIEVVERRHHRQPADKFGDKAEFEQILRLEILQDLAGLALLGRAHFGAEADRGALAALGDELFQAGEGAAADEQDVGGVDLQEFLLRMLAAALRRHRGDRAFHDLQQRLLHTFARDVAGDRRVIGFAAYLIDLVDIDDAALRAFDIVVGGLQQLQDDVLDVLADIAGFGQGRGIRHGEGHVDDARQRLRQQRLARTGRADQQDVGLGKFDVVALGAVGEPFVMVMDGHRQHAFGVILADDVVVEHLADVARRRHPVPRLDQRRLVLLTDDVHAELDAFVADEDGRSGDELADLVLALAAEGAVEGVLRISAARLGHGLSVTTWDAPSLSGLMYARPVPLPSAEPTPSFVRFTTAGRFYALFH